MTCSDILQIITAIILGITALFIIFYWKETQRMKEQMIEQNNLAKKQIKNSSMPILDVIIEQVESAYTGDFAYDIFLINKGTGSALNVSIQKIPSNVSGQKEAIHEAPNRQIEYFLKNINIIGKDEKAFVQREHSPSYRQYDLKVFFHDIFRDRYEWEFEGDRDGLTLKRYEKSRQEIKLS